MERRDIEDRQIAERYLQGRLTADQERAFEEAYLGDPDLLDDLILTEKLQQGLRLHGREVRARNRWSAVFASPRYAAAATVLLALSVTLSGTLYLENRSMRDGGLEARFEGSGVTRLLPLVTVRGDDVNEVARPETGEWVVFLVDAGFTEYDEYRAVVSRRTPAGNESVRQLEGLVPTYDGMLPIGLPGGLLAPGDYEILVEGRMADWPADRESDPIGRTPLRIAER